MKMMGHNKGKTLKKKDRTIRDEVINIIIELSPWYKKMALVNEESAAILLQDKLHYLFEKPNNFEFSFVEMMYIYQQIILDYYIKNTVSVYEITKKTGIKRTTLTMFFKRNGLHLITSKEKFSFAKCFQ
jgi:predicted DNA-binding protein YlxM (UPF0122 family)